METPCAIARSLEVLGERWTFLVVREALSGTTRFTDFRAALGVASDILISRLNVLVDAGVLERRPYKVEGRRAREEYHLTEPGRELMVALGALMQWGDAYRPYSFGPTVERRSADGRPLRVAFVDGEGREVPLPEVRFERTPAYSTP